MLTCFKSFWTEKYIFDFYNKGYVTACLNPKVHTMPADPLAHVIPRASAGTVLTYLSEYSTLIACHAVTFKKEVYLPYCWEKIWIIQLLIHISYIHGTVMELGPVSLTISWLLVDIFCWGSRAFTMWISKGSKQILEGPSIEIHYRFSNFRGPTGFHKVPTGFSGAQGGRFENTYELLNPKALKISMLYENCIFQCMGKIFGEEFQRFPLKFHTKYLTHALKDVHFIHRWKFKSS